MARIALFPTCVVDAVAPQVGVAAVRVLRRAGHDVSVPRDATCCGQPAWNAGFAEDAAKVARTTLEALEGEELVCVPAGSCATMMRVFWPELFHVVGDEDAAARSSALGPRIREFSELAGVPGGLMRGVRGGSRRSTEEDAPTTRGADPPIGRTRVAYHHSCHMLRELGLRSEPLEALRSLEGCDVVHWSGDERCCGFGGLFSVKQPETSVAMADDKIDSLKDSGAEMLVGCDSSCLMHLEGRLRRRGERMPVKHLAEVIDEGST